MNSTSAWWLIWAGALAGMVWHASALAESGGDGADRVFVGYLFRRPDTINFALYTHLCHAFLVADEEGTILTRRGVPSRELTNEAHRNGVKVLLSLGGWGWDQQFAKMTTQPAAADRYLSAVMRIVDEYDYDGIDLDWEYPDTAAEVAGFQRLVRGFRDRLDGIGQKKSRRMLQTMAASANPGTLKWLNNDILLQTMDWINVMTYDFAGPWTDYAGHHAPLYPSSRQPSGRRASVSTTMNYLVQEKGLPADHLAVGIPLYGRGFAASQPYAATQNRADVPIPGGSFRNLYQLQREQGWTRSWDDETKNPWLSAPDGSVVIGFDDIDSVSMKTEWAMQNGFRGIFFWEIGADLLPDKTNPLQEISREKWDETNK